jgi:hypothetical protein
MKKMLLVFAAMAAIALSIPAWGASITVTTPAVGADWCIGTGYTVTWTKSGTMPDTVKIRLRRWGAPESEDAVWNIIDGTPNDGSYGTAPVPASVPAGDYYIRVRTNDPDVIGDSAKFQIVNCTPTITVTSPNASSDWAVGSTHTITWTRSGTMPDTVKIRLRRWGAPEAEDAVESIATGVANDGTSDPWNIPNSVPEGDYFIRVRTDSPDVIGDSAKFHIEKVTIDPGILEKLKRRRYWEIKWPPGPDPCLCPEWKLPDFRDFRDFLGNRFGGSIVLMKNGAKLQELARFGGKRGLPGSVKANLGRQDFNLLKNGGAKFSIAILDSNGSILNESALEQGAQEQLLR